MDDTDWNSVKRACEILKEKTTLILEDATYAIFWNKKVVFDPIDLKYQLCLYDRDIKITELELKDREIAGLQNDMYDTTKHLKTVINQKDQEILYFKTKLESTLSRKIRKSFKKIFR